MKKTKTTSELTFRAARKPKIAPKTMNTGMHLQPASDRNKCKASKRSSVQGFTFG